MTNSMLARNPMADDYPQTPETIAAALEAQAAERRQAEQESGGTLKFRPDGTPQLASDELIAEIKRLADRNIYQFPSLPQTALSRYHSLQLAETEAAMEIADRIAEVAFGAEDAAHVEGRREQAMCRFLGVHAIRLTKDHWQKAAMERAITRCVDVMQHEGGRLFAGCSPEHLRSLATLLAPRVVSAYHSISEGTQVLSPGEYLEIVNGGGK